MCVLLQTTLDDLRMEDEFPPLPIARPDLQRLVEMFPSVERSVIELVIEGVEGRLEEAMELLLSMSGSPAKQHVDAVPREPSSSSLKAVATILGELQRHL